MRGYAICGERRSGSNYLCSMLASTGVLGIPTEYFCAPAMRRVRDPNYPTDPELQLQCILQMAATPNGIYGLKLHSVEFDQIKGSRWAERLPALSFIYLERRDVLGQAISWVRASQSEQWVSFAAPEAVPVYNHAQINSALLYILNSQRRWEYYFSRNGIPVLHLFYEDIAQASQEAIESVGRLMGLTEKPRIDFSRVRLEVQRDAVSDEWHNRFIAESKDLARFD